MATFKFSFKTRNNRSKKTIKNNFNCNNNPQQYISLGYRLFYNHMLKLLNSYLCLISILKLMEFKTREVDKICVILF